MRETFLKQPVWKKKIENSPIYLGVCLSSNLGTKGVELAPDSIREISQTYTNVDGRIRPLKIFNPERGYLLDKVLLEDASNIKGQNTGNRTTKKVREILEKNNIPLIVGGDHYITSFVLPAYSQELTVVQFDAHSDYLDDEGCLHGSVMREVNRLDCVKKIIHCGLRGNLNSGPGIQDTLEKGNQVLTSNQLKNQGIEVLLRQVNEKEAVYITFDVDFFDPSVCPATGYPEPGGIDYETARQLLCELAKKTDVVGVDFVEYNPKKDWNQIGGIHLTNLIIEFLSAKFK